MVVQGVRYVYTLELDDARVISETLVSYPERKPRTILERDDMDVERRRISHSECEWGAIAVGDRPPLFDHRVRLVAVR